MTSLKSSRTATWIGDLAGTAAWLCLRVIAALPARLLASLLSALRLFTRRWPASPLHQNVDDLHAIVTAPFGPDLLRRLGRAGHPEIRDIVRGALLRRLA